MITYRIRNTVLLFLLVQILFGCSVRSSNMDLGISDRIELKDTPFFPQEKYQCGPASLAMILASSGVNIRPEELVPRIYIPEKKGSFQVELQAAARSFGRIPYILEPRLHSLIEELRAGRPILVLQNYGLESLPSYHYAVVVGMSPEKEVILRSGTERRQIMDLPSFLMSWLRSGAWAMVVLRPGEMVQHSKTDSYLSAVAAFEKVNGARAAHPAYRIAVSTWPDDPLSWFALGNNALERKSLEKAEQYYRRVLLLDDTHIGALNNLADLLARKGCYDEATRLILRAAEQIGRPDTAVAELVNRTEREIDQMRTTSDVTPVAECMM